MVGRGFAFIAINATGECAQVGLALKFPGLARLLRFEDGGVAEAEIFKEFCLETRIIFSISARGDETAQFAIVPGSFAAPRSLPWPLDVVTRHERNRLIFEIGIETRTTRQQKTEADSDERRGH